MQEAIEVHMSRIFAQQRVPRKTCKISHQFKLLVGVPETTLSMQYLKVCYLQVDVLSNNPQKYRKN